MSQEDHTKTVGGFIADIYKIRGGIVRDEITAIKLAKVIVEGIHGNEIISEQEPWHASEEEHNWVVKGSASDIRFSATVVVSKSDGRILRIEVPTTLENMPTILENK